MMNHCNILTNTEDKAIYLESNSGYWELAGSRPGTSDNAVSEFGCGQYKWMLVCLSEK